MEYNLSVIQNHLKFRYLHSNVDKMHLSMQYSIVIYTFMTAIVSSTQSQKSRLHSSRPSILKILFCVCLFNLPSGNSTPIYYTTIQLKIHYLSLHGIMLFLYLGLFR